MLAPPTLLAPIDHFRDAQVLAAPGPRLADAARAAPDLAEIKRQETAKRARGRRRRRV